MDPYHYQKEIVMEHTGKLLAACSLGTLHSIREDLSRWKSEIDSVVIEHDRTGEHEQTNLLIDLVSQIISEHEE